MEGKTGTVVFVIFAIACVGVGLYPLLYLFIDNSVGLLSTKSPELLEQMDWRIAFYNHIALGGIALLTGWSQFNSRLRTKRLTLHRRLGKIYVIASFISGGAALYIAPNATGGLISSFGFTALGILWIYFTFHAFFAIRDKRVEAHQRLMIYSYACCFAAVTLRIWLPILSAAFGDFVTAYRIVAWLSWVPNLLVAFFIVKQK